MPHFDIVAENAIVADFQRTNSRPSFFAVFKFLEKSATVNRNAAKFVEFRVVAAVDDSAVAHGRGSIFADCVVDKFRLVAEVADTVAASTQNIARQAA